MKKILRSLSKPHEKGNSKYEQSDELLEMCSHQSVSGSDDCKEQKRKTVSDNQQIFVKKECKLERARSVNVLLRPALTLKEKIIKRARTPPSGAEPTIAEDAKNLQTAFAGLFAMHMPSTSPNAVFGAVIRNPSSKLPNTDEFSESEDISLKCMDDLAMGDFNGFQTIQNEIQIPPDVKASSEFVLAVDASTEIENESRDTMEQFEKTKNVSTNSRLIDSSAVCSNVDGVPNASILSERKKVGDFDTQTNKGNIMDYHNGREKENLDDKIAVAIKNRQYVIRELIETEKDYVRDMKEVVDGYLAIIRDPQSEIPLPEDLRGGKIKIVFGNIENIYEWHRDIFSKALENCIDHSADVGPLFKKYERKLTMYVVYCQNKPMSEHIVTEYINTYFEEIRRKLGHALTICDFLIKPVQRIMKYQLLLRDMLKHTEIISSETEIENLKQATHIMHVVPKEANDMMNVGRLQGFDGKITAQGKLLLFGPLLCSEGTSGVNFKGKEHQVFLFKHSIIFSEPFGKRAQFTNAGYIYKAHMLANQLNVTGIVDDGDPCKFIVRSTDPRKPVLSYVCQAASRESRDEWITQLKLILQTQNDFIQAIQSPIQYHKNKLANS